MSAASPGGSPLVEQIDSSVNEIRIMPGFGDGRIEYHPITVEGGAA